MYLLKRKREKEIEGVKLYGSIHHTGAGYQLILAKTFFLLLGRFT